MLCGKSLIYRTHAADMTCRYCGKTFAAAVSCPDGHYVCESCHGAGFHELLERLALTTESRDPLAIAEAMLQLPFLPSLGGEHHGIVAAALLAAVKNYGEITLPLGLKRRVTDKDIKESLRRMRQIPSCTCAYHGACGAGLGVGAVFSILCDATCAKDSERTLAMRATGAALAAITDTGGPACCKQSVRTAILTGSSLLKELCGLRLPLTIPRCFHTADTTHGCKGVACRFSR